MVVLDRLLRHDSVYRVIYLGGNPCFLVAIVLVGTL